MISIIKFSEKELEDEKGGTVDLVQADIAHVEQTKEGEITVYLEKDKNGVLYYFILDVHDLLRISRAERV